MRFFNYLTAMAYARFNMQMGGISDDEPLQIITRPAPVPFQPKEIQSQIEKNECCQEVVMRGYDGEDHVLTMNTTGDELYQNSDFSISFDSTHSIWQLKKNPGRLDVGYAFASPEKIGCPDHKSWKILQDDNWTAVNLLLTCKASTDSDKKVMKLADQVCALMKQNSDPDNRKHFKRTGNFCHRAARISRRTIKLARCQAADVMLSRSQTSTHLTEAVDTVRKWRVTLLAITDERTQQCPKMSGPLKHSINSVYDAILRLFNKQDWIIL